MFVNKRVAWTLFLSTFSHYGITEDMSIDDFSNNPESRWQYVSDQVMGGVSNGNVEYIHLDTGSLAVLNGQVSTENNGGFIQIRTEVDKAQVVHASGVYLKAKGNNQRYYIHLRTTGTILPWQYYQASFDATKDWQEFKLPLEQFTRSGSWLSKRINPRTIRSIGIVAFGRDHQAEVEIDQIGFY
jgi:hypothetical protein